MFFSVPKMQDLSREKSAKSIVDKTADTHCLSCAVFIRQLLLSVPYANLYELSNGARIIFSRNLFGMYVRLK